jgi:hypothetical protein
MMKAGRELDALVAEKVIGYRQAEDGSWFLPGLAPDLGLWELPEYSTSIAEASLLFPVLDEKWGKFWSIVRENDKWHINEDPYGYDYFEPDVVSESLPHAICLAALKAVGYNESN